VAGKIRQAVGMMLLHWYWSALARLLLLAIKPSGRASSPAEDTVDQLKI
jgi:hypothetical protein